MTVTIPSLPRRQVNWWAISAGIVMVGYVCMRVDLEDLDFAIDHGHVAGVAQPQPNGSGGGEVPAGRAVRWRGHQHSASSSQSKDSGTRYGAPSAEALATLTSMSWVSRCSVSRRR